MAVSLSADAERLLHAFIVSRLDNCKALLSGLLKKAIGQLQNIQNAAAWVLTKDKTESPHYTGFKVSALAACEF